jgi:hypothetical protein
MSVSRLFSGMLGPAFTGGCPDTATGFPAGILNRKNKPQTDVAARLGRCIGKCAGEVNGRRPCLPKIRRKAAQGRKASTKPVSKGWAAFPKGGGALTFTPGEIKSRIREAAVDSIRGAVCMPQDGVIALKA